MSLSRALSAGFCLLICGSISSASDLASVFRQLDADGNGVVTREEISDAQEPFFSRALRVGDRNKDGKLTIAELEAATQEPEPQQTIAMSRGGFGRGQMAGGLQRLDRNNDGKLSRDEVPQPLKERLAPIFERSGRDEIDLRELAQFAQRMMGSQPGDRPAESRQMQSPQRGEGDLLSGMVRRLDRDNNGEISGDEFTRAPEFLKLLDANNDGKITGDEIAIPNRSRDTTRMQRSNNASGRPNAQNTEQLFQRFDTDKDGKVSIEDLPERIQNTLKRADRNNDGQLTLQELATARQP